MKQQTLIRSVRWLWLQVLLIAVPATFICMQELHAGLNSEYRAKLSCLYKLARYVEQAGDTNQPHIRIGILGRDPFGPALDSLAAKRKAHEKSVVVARFQTPDEYTACDILFMSRDVQMEAVRQIADRTSNECVLIVGEHPQLTSNGGVVNLTIKEDGNAAIQLNLEAAQVRGLMIDARLLRVCQIVDSGVQKR
jgi:hypothetical protein